MATERARHIADLLRTALDAEHVDVVDDSARHVGHAGAADGAGHFQVLVVSERFAGLGRVACQRLVYHTLGELMHDDIHALQMRTLTPAAWLARGRS